MEFQWIKDTYKVRADMHREVIIAGDKGVITKDMGNYIGVNFYDKLTVDPLPCHPTWEATYLDTFNDNPPVKKTTASQRRYAEFKRTEENLSFREWLGIKDKPSPKYKF